MINAGKTYYSTDGSVFEFESIHEAVLAELGGDEDFYNGKRKILIMQKGVAVAPDVKSYVPDISDYMREAAYEDAGDFSDSFLYLDAETEKELQSRVSELVERVLKERSAMPTFYLIEDVEDIAIEITNAEKSEWVGIVDYEK